MRIWIIAFLMLLPLPFASARPIWQTLCLVIIALMALYTSFNKSPKRLDGGVKAAIACQGLFVLWGYFQAFVPIGHHVEIDKVLATQPVAPAIRTISVEPEQTIRTASYILSHIVLFLCVYFYCNTTTRVRPLLKAISYIAAAYAFYGFVALFSGDTILWYDKWASQGALTSTFVNRNSFATYIGLGAMVLAARLYSMLFVRPDNTLRGETAGNVTHILKQLGHHWVTVLCFIIALTALTLTGSRAGFASTYTGIFTLLVFSIEWRQVGWRKVVRVLGVGSIALVPLLLAILPSFDRLADRVLNPAREDRFGLYPYMLEAIKSEPLVGFGLGTFAPVFQFFKDENMVWQFERGHNEFLEIAMGAGIPMAIVLITGVALVLRELVKGLKPAGANRCFVALGIAISVQIGLHSLVDFPLQIPAVSYTWATILGAAVAMARVRKAVQA